MTAFSQTITFQLTQTTHYRLRHILNLRRDLCQLESSLVLVRGLTSLQLVQMPLSIRRQVVTEFSQTITFQLTQTTHYRLRHILNLRRDLCQLESSLAVVRGLTSWQVVQTPLSIRGQVMTEFLSAIKNLPTHPTYITRHHIIRLRRDLCQLESSLEVVPGIGRSATHWTPSFKT